MAITELYAGSDTFTTAEESIANNTSATTAQAITTDGIFQVFLDLSALANGDTYRVAIKEKVQSGSTQRIVLIEDISHAQTSAPNWASPALVLIHGWDVTIDKLAGADAVIAWSIRQIA
jgi:hypothetical protein